jgi:hypothetical protein
MNCAAFTEHRKTELQLHAFLLLRPFWPQCISDSKLRPLTSHPARLIGGQVLALPPHPPPQEETPISLWRARFNLSHYCDWATGSREALLPVLTLWFFVLLDHTVNLLSFCSWFNLLYVLVQQINVLSMHQQQPMCLSLSQSQSCVSRNAKDTSFPFTSLTAGGFVEADKISRIVPSCHSFLWFDTWQVQNIWSLVCLWRWNAD